ncbi:MAG: oxidoreductase [bacterium]|nr:oxidoreductase [bacterium]
MRHIVLDVTGTGFSFIEGQSVGVLIAGDMQFGQSQHLRLYSVASSRKGDKDEQETISLCVKRCSFIDDYSGEEVKGIASNYLCDLSPGAKVTLTGPYGRAFVVPGDDTCNMLMIALGTGIAPFRAFVKHIYDTKGGWKGQVRLFYGAKSGLDLAYMNDKQDDFAQYYDEGTFKAFESVSPRPHMDDPIALDRTLEENADEVWAMLQDPKTYVFIGGLEKVIEPLNAAFAKMAGSAEQWEQKKNELKGANRWFELLY